MSSGHGAEAAGGRGGGDTELVSTTYDYALHGGELPEPMGDGGRGSGLEVHLRTGPNGERITVDGQPHKTGIWTEAEDELLYMWQQRIGNKWSEVARHIPGKSGQQCAQRWRHRVNPNIKRDKWTKLEDALLVRLVELYGNQWATIARNVPGRTDQQCMGRWRRHLDPTIRRDRWKNEEDLLLCALKKKYGNLWSQISKGLDGRTPQQCRTRHQHIKSNMTKWLEQNKERIDALNVDEHERARGFDGYTGARNTKDIVKKEGAQVRDRAAMIASKMRELPDVATLGGELADKIKETGSFQAQMLPPSQNPSGSGYQNASNLLDAAEQLKGKGSGLQKQGGVSPSASKGSTPSAANALTRVFKEDIELYENELPSFMPIDVSKILQNSRYFSDCLKPTPLSVESFQPAAALRLNESSGPGMRWDPPYLTSQMAVQPFQVFQNFSPFHTVVGAPIREVGIAVNGASVLGGHDKPLPIAKPAPYLQKRVERSADIRGTTAGHQNGVAPLSSSGLGHPDDDESMAKRQRAAVDDWPYPERNEELKLRAEGGAIANAREREMMGVLYSEGFTV